MKNTFGNNLTVTLFGESHGEAIGCVIDGLSSGIEIDREFISLQMEKRKGLSCISTGRREKDEVKIVSGVFENRTTGTPLCILIENGDTRSKDYSKTKTLARPGHADYTAQCRYEGFQDYRGGGHFSGRLTAPLVAAGAIAVSALKNKGINIATHISQLGNISDRAFSDITEDMRILEEADFPVLDLKKREEMKTLIKEMKNEGDSIGGILSTVVTGMPSGIGEPWFDSVESMLSHGLFSIPAVKGVEFGKGFDFATLKGSEANDYFCIQEGKIVTETNNNGGINGGITNGMPLEFRTAVKATPSIYKKQNTVDFIKKTEEEILIEGRHDPAVIHRARVVVDSVTSLTLCDLLLTRYGGQWLR